MRSEAELSAELKNARRQGTGNLPKRDSASVADVRIVPIAPVEGVKRIRLEMKAHPFPERQVKSLPQR